MKSKYQLIIIMHKILHIDKLMEYIDNISVIIILYEITIITYYSPIYINQSTKNKRKKFIITIFIGD